jgi:hypothetical protein
MAGKKIAAGSRHENQQNEVPHFLAGLLPGLPDGIFFTPKIPNGVNFGESCKGGCWHILWPSGPLYGHLVYFVVFLWSSGNFFPFWYVEGRKIWQPCLQHRDH